MSNQFDANPIACDNDPLVSNNLNDMASAEPSNAENILDKNYIASVKRPNSRDDTQGEVFFAPKGHKKKIMQSDVLITSQDSHD